VLEMVYSSFGAVKSVDKILGVRRQRIADRLDSLMSMQEEQTMAILNSMSHALSLVQGPPGTGKTAATVHMIFNLFSEGSTKILMSAQTNACVDDCTSKILDLCSKLESSTAPFLFFDHKGILVDRNKAIQQFRDNILRIHSRQHQLDDNLVKYSLEYKVNAILAKYPENEHHKRREDIARELVQSHRLILSTLSSTESKHLKDVPFQNILIDESSQASEIELMQALNRSHKTVTLIGDHLQLAPTVYSPEAKQCGLSISCFERLFKQEKVPRVQLKYQWRMRTELANHIRCFYGEINYIDGPSISNLPQPTSLLENTYFSLLLDGDSQELQTSMKSF
jgi:hypothetical protein